MTTFDALDYHGQVAVLTEAAAATLAERWGMAHCALTCVQHFQNSTFRVETPSGARYALRVNRPKSQSLATVKSELLWLTALHRETDLLIPVPVPTVNGELLTEATAHEVTRLYVLFHWLDGDMLDHELTPAQLESVGVFMAKLHNHSAHWTPPDGFTRKTLEWDGQMDEHYQNAIVHGRAMIPPTMREIFVRVRQRVEPIMSGLGQSPQVYGLIHNDIYQKNMLFVGDSVRVLDFDNCGWGHYLLDIGVTLAKLLPHVDYAAKREALLRGYRIQRVLPDEQIARIDSFIAARIMLLALYLAGQTDHPGMSSVVPSFVAESAQQLERWLMSGSFT
ncbi:phosphotransferase [Aggregatilineales bacterium SYSU G02658]